MKKILLFFLSLWITLSLFSQKKNVLFILVDDLKPLTGAYGDDFAVTPNIDRLAERGFLFMNAYTQQAVCAPSRASMLTGLRPDRTEVWDLKTQIRDRNPDVVTLPQLFRQKGYQTYAIGKVFDPRSVDRGHDRLSWTIPYVSPMSLVTYDPKPMLGYYQSPAHTEKVRFYQAIAASRGMKGSKAQAFIRSKYKPSTERCDVPDDAYLDGAFAVNAIKYLKRFAQEGEPFMLMVGFKKPHLPFVAPEKYWKLYDRDKIPPARFQQHAKGSPELAYHKSPELRSYTDIPEAFGEDGLLSDDKQRELIHGYYACVSYVDAQIGKLLDELEKTGLDKNTVVVLWGDHGWHLGDHGLWTKHTNFEQATHLPLIISDPALQPGVTDTPVESVDIFPTVCELTGIDPGPAVQGKSLVPLMRGEKAAVDYAISQWPTRGGKGGMGYSIRTRDYRYTEYWYYIKVACTG
jgi:arylsulfatase A-like enzyme